jgi:NADH:quinone reductase (non-electrogenic)
MATIGRSAAVAQIGRLEFSGWPAWAAWLLVHLIFLVGFRNKAAVLLQWTYSYFTYKLGSRIVFGLENSEGPLAASVEPHNPAREPGETKPSAP